MTQAHLNTLRAISDAQNQSQWAKARSLVYFAIVQAQKEIADQKQQGQGSDPLA